MADPRTTCTFAGDSARDAIRAYVEALEAAGSPRERVSQVKAAQHLLLGLTPHPDSLAAIAINDMAANIRKERFLQARMNA